MQPDINKHFSVFPFVLVFIEIITFLSMDMYLPALPLIADDFKISQELAQYTQTFWFVGTASMPLLLGPVTEKFSRRSILLIGLVLFTIACFLCATTTNLDLFLFARFIQGTTVSIVIVAGYATIHHLYTGTKAVQLLAVMGSITILAPALGPLFGALIISYWDWHDIFCILTSLALLGLLGVYCTMPIIVNTNNINNQNNKWLKNIIQDYKSIFINRQFIRITTISCFVIVCFFIWIVVSPFIIITTYSKSVLYYGYVQLFVFGGFICGTQLAKYLITKISARNLCDAGLTVVGMSLILFTVFSYLNLNIKLIIFAMVGIALGASMLSGLLNRLAIESVDQYPMGQRVAAYSTLFSLSASIGSYIVTLIMDLRFDKIAFLMLVFVMLAIIIYKSIRSEIKLKD